MTRTVDIEALPTRERIIRSKQAPVAGNERSKAWDHGKRERKVSHRCDKLNTFLDND